MVCFLEGRTFPYRVANGLVISPTVWASVVDRGVDFVLGFLGPGPPSGNVCCHFPVFFREPFECIPECNTIDLRAVREARANGAGLVSSCKAANLRGLSFKHVPRSVEDGQGVAPPVVDNKVLVDNCSSTVVVMQQETHRS